MPCPYSKERGKAMTDFEKLTAEIMRQMAEDGTPVTQAEAEEMAKMETGAKNIRRRETSGKRKASAPKPRKIDPDKLKLFNLLTEAVGDFTNGMKCKNEAEFSFSYNGNAYTVKLIKHRPKK